MKASETAFISNCKISQTVTTLLSGKKVKDISDMIDFNDNIIVGLSGGADSVALTYFLCSLAKYFNLRVIGCHVNHGIRGKEAEADQEFVRIYCKNLGIKLLEKNLNLLKLSSNSKQSLEELGRIYRYDFFRECSYKYNAKIATAHNMNDNAETVILNLIRGAGLKGVCGIPKVRGNIIRPFINFTRADIEKYCETNSLTFVVDSTNLSVDYNRNLVRHKIIPIILKMNSSFASTINRNCDIILEDELFLEKLASDALKNISTQNGYMIDKFNLYQHNIKNRIVKLILKLHALPYDYKKINLISDFISNNKSYKFCINNEKYFLKDNNILYVKKIENVYNENLFVKLYSSESKKYLSYNILKYKDIKDKIMKDKTILKQCVDFDNIIGEPIVRHKQDGDRIKLAYRHLSKSLKKLFNEEKLDINERNKRLIISDEMGVIWAQGFGADERANVNESTKSVLFLTMN